MFKNVAKAAWDKISTTGVVLENGWKRHPARLTKTYSFDSYTEALEAAKKVNEISNIMDHHANMNFTHKCVHGVDLEFEFFTYEVNEITEKDYDSVKAMDIILSKDTKVEITKYSYSLKEESIAKYPASPRGS